jgi:hypothetical protein
MPPLVIQRKNPLDKRLQPTPLSRRITGGA